VLVPILLKQVLTTNNFQYFKLPKYYFCYRKENSDNMSYDLLVNKQNKLPATFVPENLVIVDDNENNFRGYHDAEKKPMVEKRVLNAFLKMQAAAKQSGYELIIIDGYRSFDYQGKIFENYAEKKGMDYANQYVALPGTSEHQTGLAIDIGAFHEGVYSDELSEAEIKWLKDNAYKYGFILRYPEGKESITGYSYEPWHYRYVGTSLAKKIYNLNITLEEYHFQYKK